MKRKILWAPWRIKYIQGLINPSPCFVCHNLNNPQEDKENYVLWRWDNCMAIFNKFPYNNGHILVAPNRHIASLDEATDAEMLEMMKMVRDVKKVLKKAIRPDGFNVGINFGRCAGAGLPDHMHIHIVPRWNGDTNYMHVCSDTDVISQGMDELYLQLVEISTELSLYTEKGV